MCVVTSNNTAYAVQKVRESKVPNDTAAKSVASAFLAAVQSAASVVVVDAVISVVRGSTDGEGGAGGDAESDSGDYEELGELHLGGSTGS